MDLKELQELITLISESNLAEFKLDNGDMKLSIRTKHYMTSKVIPQIAASPIMPMQTAVQPLAQPVPQVSAPVASSGPRDTEEDDADNNYVEVRSPIVGTFYRSSAPEKPPFVKVGDSVSQGTVVCIVEAMKLFNEIESEVSGRVVKVLIDDASPVEYDQALFIVDPNG